MLTHKDHFHGSDLEKIEKIYGIRKEEIISFSANVNPLGISPLLRRTLTEHIDAITAYPDREYTSLRQCIAGYCGCEAEHVIVGNGSTELISLFIQIEHPKKALIYVCRKSRLAENLSRPGVAAFLAGYGYGELDVDAAIERLKSRFDKGEDFPHEIGVFLDYPLGDVIGFIENSGHNYKCSGCWKVYCDECESRRLFAMYQKCRDIYTRLYEQGRSVFQLTVAA